MRFLILIIFLTSCATPRKLTRDEWLIAGQKKYPLSITKDKLIKSAEKVLVLADENDVNFQYSDTGFTASRNWLIYAVIAAAMGTDYWRFDVKEEKGELVASVQPSQTSGSVTGYSAGNGNVGTVTAPTIGNPLQGTAIYDMFWSRLDFILGLRSDWLDCKSGLQKISKGETWGNLDNICDSVTLRDDYPLDLSDLEIERIFKNNQLGKEAYLSKKKKAAN